jgi:hypothetical protein
MPNRCQLKVQGSTYTFPINPREYQNQDSFPYSKKATLDGPGIRFTTFFDDRSRVMTWRDLPNKSPYNTLPANLKASVGVSGVQFNHRDLDINGDLNVWRDIMVDNVAVRIKSGPSDATSKLAYDIDFVFSYIR